MSIRDNLAERRPGNARLDESMVRAIKRRLDAGEPRRSIAADFGVHRSTVGEIATGRRWAHVSSDRDS